VPTPEAESTGQGHGALIPEAQCSGSLARFRVRLVDALKERRADGTALTGSLEHKQTIVDLARPDDQLAEVLESGEEADVLRLVDDGLDAKSPPFFQVLLDATVLEAEVDLHLGARREDPGPECDVPNQGAAMFTGVLPIRPSLRWLVPARARPPNLAP